MSRAATWSFRAYAIAAYALFAAIVFVPLLSAAWCSVHDDTGFSLRAYRTVLSEPRQWGLLATSLSIAGATTLAATLAGTAAALALEYWRVPARTLLIGGMAIAFLIPNYAAAVAWIDVLGGNGLLHKVIERGFGCDYPIPAIANRAGVVFVLSLAYYPVVAITTALGLRRVDRRLIDAARLAATPGRAFRCVLLPLLTPSIAAGSIIVFLLSLQNFAVPSMLQVNTYPVEVFTAFSAFYDFGGATAQSAPLVLCGLAALLVGVRYAGARRAWLSGRSRTCIPAPRGTLLRVTMAAACGLLVCVSSAVPLGVLFWRSLPLSSYAGVFRTAQEEILTSFAVAATAATVLTALAFSLAYLERRRAVAIPSHVFSLIVFLLSGPVLGIALIAAWNRSGLPGLVYDSMLIVVLACAARYLFFVQRAFVSAFSEIAGSVEEAAYMAGVPWWRTLSEILLPILWPAVVGMWGFSFVLCMGELDAVALVCPPGVTTLAVRVHSLMHYGPSSMAAALSVVSVAVVLLSAAITAAVYRKGMQVRHARA